MSAAAEGLPAGTLACTVRGCGAPLAREGRAWRCPRGHTFDVARRGYVNLLQPQDRRSTEAGDSTEAVAARARLLARGVGVALFDDLAAVARGLGLPRGAVVFELGCGTGDLLRRVTAELGLAGVGLDLSTPAIEHAARIGVVAARPAPATSPTSPTSPASAASAATPASPASATSAATPASPGPTWVVANADRRLPLGDGAAALALSVHGRRNPGEVARVLAPGGYWLVAVPGADDLVELRAAARGGEAEGRTRVADLVAEVGAGPFELAAEGTTRARHELDRAALADACAGTYRGLRRSEAERLAGLAGLTVTLHSDWALFRRR